LVFTNRIAINGFAIKEKLPTVHRLKEYAIDGGLISYGPDFITFFRRAAEYVDKILKGAKAEDMPVEQPTTYQLVVNLKTAKAIGLAIPPTADPRRRSDRIGLAMSAIGP
jgi:putative tryptophan/tyrosine transport system substrate-binding protein